MEKRSIFKLGDYLSQLEVVSVEETKVVDRGASASSATSAPVIRDASTRDGEISSCNSCKKSFDSPAEQRQHYQSKWHLYNVKLRAAGLKRISETEFSKVVDASTTAEDPAIHNKEDDDDAHPHDGPLELEVSEIVNNSSPKVTFYAQTKKAENVALSVWKLVLLPKVRGDHHVQAYLSALRESPNKDQWGIFMCTGGYFAGAIFKKGEVLQHKRIARYTVRRKQGGAQGAHDSAGGNAQSAGAHIRRMNEKKLKEEIAEILAEWRWSFIYEGSPLQKDDPRVRSIPFTTMRPSFMELKRVHQVLSTVVVGPAAQAQGQLVDESLRQSTDSFISNLSASTSSIGSVQANSTYEDNEQVHEVQEEDLLLAAVRAGDSKQVAALLDEGYEQPLPMGKNADMNTPLALAYELGNMQLCRYLILEREDADLDFRLPQHKFRTVLHLAASKNDEVLVNLLLQNGADPTVKDLHGLTPYDLVQDKEARLIFRRFAGDYPDVWDYTAAKIPPLSREQEADKKSKEAQKKKKKKQAAKEKKKIQSQQEKEEQELQQQQEQERKQAAALRQARIDAEKDRDTRIMSMSEREKRALAAERRLAAMTGKSDCCAWCGKQLITVPFERLNFKYCTTTCVVQHKAELGK